MLIRLPELVFVTTRAACREAGEMALLFASGLRHAPSLARGWRAWLGQLNRLGVNSLPLVLLIGFFTGMVVSLQAGVVLKQHFGAEAQVGLIVGLSMVREMGPVITGFILAGRAGASIAAELGTMSVGEEVDALRALGISPVRYLYVPRLFAMLLMQPLLTVFAIAIGIWGGGLVTATYLQFPIEIYYLRVFEAVRPRDLFDGLSKTVLFAAVTATIATHMGLAARRGAEGVGRATTRAVVWSLALILVVDYLAGRFLATPVLHF